MKKSFILSAILVLTSLMTIRCSKEETETTIDTEDIAEDIAYSLSSDNGGITAELVIAAESASTAENSTEVSSKTTAADTIISYDTTYSYSGTTSNSTTYDFTLNFNYGYVFQTSANDYLYYNSTIKNTVDALRIYVSENRTSEWNITGFEIGYSAYTINGIIERTGTSVLKVRSKSNIYSSSSINFSDIEIDKSDYTITGNLNWIISGTVNNQKFYCEVSIEYLGNGKANISIEGNVYTIYISTGEFV